MRRDDEVATHDSGLEGDWAHKGESLNLFEDFALGVAAVATTATGCGWLADDEEVNADNDNNNDDNSNWNRSVSYPYVFLRDSKNNDKR